MPHDNNQTENQPDLSAMRSQDSSTMPSSLTNEIGQTGDSFERFCE